MPEFQETAAEAKKNPSAFPKEQLKTPLLHVSKVTPRCEKSRGKFHTQNACGIFCAGKGTGNGEYSSTGGDAYAGSRLADAQRAAVFPAT